MAFQHVDRGADGADERAAVGGDGTVGRRAPAVRGNDHAADRAVRAVCRRGAVGTDGPAGAGVQTGVAGLQRGTGARGDAGNPSAGEWQAAEPRDGAARG